MSGPTQAQVRRWMSESEAGDYGEGFICWMQRFAALAYAAGQASERVGHAAEIKSLGEAILRQHEEAERLAFRVLNHEADLVAAVSAEREACAKLCDDDASIEAQYCAAAIRARGSK